MGTELIDLPRLLSKMHHKANRRFAPRFAKLNQRVAEVIDDYSLVSFSTLNVEDKHSMFSLLKVVDKSNGYCLDALSQINEMPIQPVGVGNADWQYEQVG